MRDYLFTGLMLAGLSFCMGLGIVPIVVLLLYIQVWMGIR